MQLAIAVFVDNVDVVLENNGSLLKSLCLCDNRKKLDPLDTYVPTVVLAQLQFQDVGMCLFTHFRS